MSNNTNGDSTLCPAESLEGHTLDDGWVVSKKIKKNSSQTGGCFSEAYLVERNGNEKAFLKAMDYRKAFNSQDRAKNLQIITTEINFEKNLLEHCKGSRMSKVIKSIHCGSLLLDQADPLSAVEYIILELAEGDIREYMENMEELDIAWTFRVLHNVAIGLRQLHSKFIAHQDIKPSNVLVFSRNLSKVSDLGCASTRVAPGPRDHLKIAGDPNYAAIEHLYGFHSAEWEIKRLAADCYMFGSLITFLFTTVSMTTLLLSKLGEEFHPHKRPGTYEQVLPYIKQSFSEVLVELKDYFECEIPEFKEELLLMIKQLCNPDPNERGHPENISNRGSSYSFERYIAKLANCARRSEAMVG